MFLSQWFKIKPRGVICFVFLPTKNKIITKGITINISGVNIQLLMRGLTYNKVICLLYVKHFFLLKKLFWLQNTVYMAIGGGSQAEIF